MEMRSAGEGVADVVGLGKGEGQDKGGPGFLQRVQALVLIAAAFDDVLLAELISDPVGAQRILPVTDGENLGHVL